MLVRTVLLVEDYLPILTLFREACEGSGFQVLTASSLAEGLELSQTKPIDVAVIDQRLGDGSGLNLLARLQLAAPSVRTILLSGDLDPGTIEAARKLGVGATIEKPVKSDRLVQVIEEVCRG